MEDRDINIDLFERYLEGTLDEKELLEFEARLAYDSNFKNEFENYELVERGIRMHFRDEMKSRFSEIDSDLDGNSKKSQGRTRKLIYWSSAIAASLIIGIFLFQHFSVNKNELIANQYWVQDPGLPVKMSTKGKYDDAMNAYKLEEWDKASSLLSKIDSDTASYFLGVIAFEEKNFNKSSIYFRKIESTSTYFEEAQFRLGLVYLSEGQIKKTKAIFKEQIKNKSKFSRILMEILKKID